MISIILTGHGSFAEGILSVTRLIAGTHDNVFCVTFPETDNVEQLSAKLEHAISQSEDEVLILADMVGGSPFKTAVTLRASMPHRRIEVLGGTNAPLAIEAVLGRDGQTLDSLIPNLLEIAKFCIRQYIPAATTRAAQDDDGDGI